MSLFVYSLFEIRHLLSNKLLRLKAAQPQIINNSSIFLRMLFDLERKSPLLAYGSLVPSRRSRSVTKCAWEGGRGSLNCKPAPAGLLFLIVSEKQHLEEHSHWRFPAERNSLPRWKGLWLSLKVVARYCLHSANQKEPGVERSKFIG